MESTRHVPFIIIAKNPQAVYIALEDVGDKIFIALGIGPADTVLVNFRIDENLALVQAVPGPISALELMPVIWSLSLISRTYPSFSLSFGARV